MLHNKIKVFARIKPPKDSVKSHVYEIKGNKSDNGVKKVLLLHGGDEKFCANPQQKFQDTEEFLFENIFTENTTQETIYNSMAKPVVERAIEGFNGTIMAYGQTGTGKTHTICGGRDKGIIPRAFKDVFHKMKEIKQNFKAFLSVMEIYNEHAYDLLSDRFTKIGLRRDKTKQVTPRNLKTVQVSNMHQLDKLLKKAWSNRIVSETPMNDTSSRSHCIFSLHLHQNNISTMMISKIHMIDLSGSEKLGKRRPSGILLNETRHINLSLHYIELVIRALSDKNRDHIPYRNSMITSFLRDSLGGNSNTVMVFTLSLEPMFFEETVLTCRFAQRVSLISNKMKKQISQSHDMEFIKNENDRLQKNNELESMEFEREIDNATTGNHKGITCKLDSSSTSSSSSGLCDTDKMNIFDDEELSKYIDEVLSEEDLYSLQQCYEKHQGEERNNIIELNSIQRTLKTPPITHVQGSHEQDVVYSGLPDVLIELTKAFKMFAPKSVGKQHNGHCVYEHLGLCLPARNPWTGKLYKTNEKEEYFKFLSRTLNIKNFKSEYYDQYCDLLVKEYHASSAFNKFILFFEKSKNKLGPKKPFINSDKLDCYEKKLRIMEIKMEEKKNLLEEVKNERISLLRKVEDLRKLLFKQFHEEWLPEKENIIHESRNNSVDNIPKSTKNNKTSHKNEVEKQTKLFIESNKTIGKSKSNTTEYSYERKIPESKFRKKLNKAKFNNVTSDTMISCLSKVSKVESATSSEE